MSKSFKEALKNRRSCYAITDKSPITDEQIKEILSFALLHVPSAFNSQSTRLVLLLGAQHKKLWETALKILKGITPQASFAKTEQKINGCFACGYGTVLFFEDTASVKALQDKFPTYKDNFPVWSEHTNAMHQLAIWTMLEDEGFGATLQHYNPLIDEEVRKIWNIDAGWKLRAQMPFGVKSAEPDPKQFGPLEPRLKIFK
ncbi:MAG: nitroreductase family protein [Elusimicrobium sp.]|jgi:predicted oxidoreductase (fatty acid repression mutant protein)|nr:nitroreductase family protein [Elusimicrobium sp.]